jgi:hypothetical protein
MEKDILNLLNFDLYSPTAITFIKLYDQIMQVDMKTLKTAFYLADLMLLPSSSAEYAPSLMGSASLFIAMISNELSTNQV